VLGASAGHIAGRHIFHFLRIAIIAVGIGLPMVYWLMEEWLGAFAYRIQQNAAGAAIVALVTSLLIIVSAGYAALRAGMVNPVKVINKV
jgi:putative ABC transport system permease protein